MSEPHSTLENMSPEQLAQAKKWVETWKRTGPILEQIRRDELRKLDTFKVLSNLLGPVDFTKEPFRSEPTSGLVEQQRRFMKFKR